MTARVGRRALLGYAGSAAAGAAVAGTAGAVAWSQEQDHPADPATGASPAGRSHSPYGVHQPGVAAPTPQAVTLVALDLRSGVDRDALARLLRLWTGDIEALTQGRGAPGDTTPWLATAGADLTVTVGVGPGPVRAGLLPGLDGFGEIPPMRHDRLEERWSGGDLLVSVGGRDGTTVGHAVRRLTADAEPFARLRWRQHGSWNGLDGEQRPVTGRNLFGQVDGSRNPQPGTDLFDQTVWVRSGAWAGGTTLALRRIRMDLATWDELTRDEQERSTGRDLAAGAPLTGGVESDDVDLLARADGRFVVARDAHVRRSHPASNQGRRIFRKGANYSVEEWTDGGLRVESGLLFQSFQADLTDQFVRVQRTVDELDALNEWTTAIGSAAFAILPGFEKGSWLGEPLLT
ncbi:Dyp-type peroxidase [Nocardioides ferulae]|uniref:Dyp-type peroxidase n=1 Tax=Nocardioides ferulae TaxID=2340821 RepID=UPI000EB1B43A|nr:Dyp-type peroxidase [Nocardioides ferulae]